MCLVTPPKKVIETGEMLNMLNVLNVLGKIEPKAPKHLTYLTFPLFQAIFEKKDLTFPLFRDPMFTKQGKYSQKKKNA